MQVQPARKATLGGLDLPELAILLRDGQADDKPGLGTEVFPGPTADLHSRASFKLSQQFVVTLTKKCVCFEYRRCLPKVV
jgi:hypothetical protein